MPSVGILTVHQSVNCGASLQAAALYRTVEELGHSPQIINYCPRYFMGYMDESNRDARRTPKGRIKVRRRLCLQYVRVAPSPDILVLHGLLRPRLELRASDRHVRVFGIMLHGGNAVGSSYRSAHCQACYEAPFWCSVTGVPSARIKLACVVFPKATRVCGAASFAPRRIRQRHRW